eukprot:NODE_3271_length_953_cov_6.977876_g2717_i0.p5 GENE.NODE_3271_length_953_cov_6.977876_g2717_i0~~NODE_3271_length_953_cov_6.977876_g2717_i0.p5  ORF type:complete len:68 (+),score=2.61 NODE_3271_length_953_cov_6.977876_g2717_i0:494-697(+)
MNAAFGRLRQGTVVLAPSPGSAWLDPAGREGPLGLREGRGQQLRCCWPMTGPAGRVRGLVNQRAEAR